MDRLVSSFIVSIAIGSMGLFHGAVAQTTDPSQANSVEPARVEPARVEPARVESAEVEPAEVEPAEVEPAEVEPAEVEPVEVEPARVEPAGDGFSTWNELQSKKNQGQMKQVNVISDCENCANNEWRSEQAANESLDDISAYYTASGEFASGFLVIEAAVDGEKPFTEWDGFYLKMQRHKFYDEGGHLVLENSLPIPQSETSSRYLFNLNEVVAFKSLSDKINKSGEETFDFFSKYLQNGNLFRILAFVSSARPGRVIKEISVYYECAQGSSCKLTSTPSPRE